MKTGRQHTRQCARQRGIAFRFVFLLIASQIPHFALPQQHCRFLYSTPGRLTSCSAGLSGRFAAIRNRAVEICTLDQTGIRTVSTFSRAGLGQPKLVDALNPHKMLVFYADQNSLLVLDQELSPLGEAIALESAGIWTPVAVCASLSGLCWVIDHSSNQLLLLDVLLRANVRKRLVLEADNMPLCMKEYESRLYVGFPQFISVFDQTGNLLEQIETPPYSVFQPAEGKLWLTVPDSSGLMGLETIDIKTRTRMSYILPQSTAEGTYCPLGNYILHCTTEKSQVYKITDNQIKTNE